MNQHELPRIGILQRVLPVYRAHLFDQLAEVYGGKVSVFAGKGRKQEMIAPAVPQRAHYYFAHNHHFLHGAFYTCWQGGLLAWLKEWDPHVLIMEANPRYLHSPAALRWMRSHGRKVIGWGLGAPVISHDNLGIRHCLRKRFVRQFDAIITYSTQGAREYQEIAIDPSRIFIAPNAATPRPTRVSPDRPDVYRGGKPVIVFVGRLQERKRVDVLIEACAYLPAESQPLLWVIGDGPDRGALEKLAREIYPLATFFGALHGNDLGQRLAMADLFILPGTGGLAVQEAMSYGLPVIVGEADGTQSDLVRDENGWLLSDPSPRALAKLMVEALADVAALREKGRESYRIVSEEINLEKMARVFSNAISEVMRD